MISRLRVGIERQPMSCTHPASLLITRVLNVLHCRGDSLAGAGPCPLAQNGGRVKPKRLGITTTDHMFVLQLYDVRLGAEWAR